MNADRILAKLQRNDGHFAKDAILEAVAHRDEMVPALLDILRSIPGNPEPYVSDQRRMDHIYAMYLLAQFRVSEAYPLLIQIFSLPGETPFDLVGDTVTEGLGRILASVSDGDIRGMTTLIEDDNVNPYVRSAAMQGLVTLVACGLRTREEIVTYFHGLFRTFERKRDDVWGFLACSTLDLWPDKLAMDDLWGAWNEGLIDPMMLHWKDVKKAHMLGQDASMQRLIRRNRLVTDVKKEMAWWACFDKDRKAEAERQNAARFEEESLHRMLQPVRRTSPKIGRNDPCPCGGGKKYKKCCGS